MKINIFEIESERARYLNEKKSWPLVSMPLRLFVFYSCDGSQVEAARRLGVDATRISTWLHGRGPAILNTRAAKRLLAAGVEPLSIYYLWKARRERLGLPINQFPREPWTRKQAAPRAVTAADSVFGDLI